MTEHEKGAEKFAETLGGLEGREKPLDKYEQREQERHEMSRLATEAQIAFHRAHGADAELSAATKRVNLQRHPIDVARAEHADKVWEREIDNAQAHRSATLAVAERQTAAWESIADSLAKWIKARLP